MLKQTNLRRSKLEERRTLIATRIADPSRLSLAPQELSQILCIITLPIQWKIAGSKETNIIIDMSLCFMCLISRAIVASISSVSRVLRNPLVTLLYCLLKSCHRRRH